MRMTYEDDIPLPTTTPMRYAVTLRKEGEKKVVWLRMRTSIDAAIPPDQPFFDGEIFPWEEAQLLALKTYGGQAELQCFRLPTERFGTYLNDYANTLIRVNAEWDPEPFLVGVDIVRWALSDKPTKKQLRASKPVYPGLLKLGRNLHNDHFHEDIPAKWPLGPSPIKALDGTFTRDLREPSWLVTERLVSKL